jgi:membrane fusion protein (multidrug efflux system)
MRQKLASVINPAELEIQVQVPAQDLELIKQGVKGEFRSPGKNEPLQVVVLGMSPFVDPTTGTATGQLKILSRAKPFLSPGIQGQATFKANIHPGFSILESAVIYQGKSSYVRVVEDGKIKLLQVELGSKQRGRIEVLKGLKGGESLVERASRFVGAGESVKAE